jgi:ferredoxin
MPQEIYQQLARRLDDLPNGFPATASGVELRLLAKMFTPDEATLGAAMSPHYETADEIADRAGVDARAAYRTLKQMARHGLIYAGRGEGKLTFALMPFVVGIYEMQLPRMDAELAALFEAYLQETRGGDVIHHSPPVHRVIPVEESIGAELRVFPYDSASALLENAKSWGVRDCICRVQRHLVGAGCDHPVETCLTFAPVEGVFDHSPVDRALTKEEALEILRQTEEAGLVHTVGNYRDGHAYICNCCTCSCALLRAVAEFGLVSAVSHSQWLATVDEEVCAGCGDCVERCQFGALSLPLDLCVVDTLRCVGCGQCVTICPSDALRMVHREQADLAALPNNERDWMVQRARERGIPLDRV